ncbi:hypothetical protein BCR34DRAFT_556800 [Clohesyomyces aquaticus]|uniref:Uncharacterized protein n=1 Tax=Clohesyomyces aquaticus TaxID=1231657 RepID=A0A1Y2A249_9PLEO|nr:hypothetical protein BCR34DRAFT_556800 [Clohesyomyces aquaticus]
MEVRRLDFGVGDGEWGDLAGVLHGGLGEGRELAMVHQLRCLGVLRSEIKSLRDGEVGRGNGDTDSVDCLEYLRQVVLCDADDTLEVDGGLRGERECRDAAWLFNVSSSGGL